MKIAICDDDIRYLDYLTSRLSLYMDFQGAEFFKFSNSAELLSAMEKEHFSFFFLDIDMPGINGIELGNIICQNLPLSIIIFVTNHEKYAIDAFDCNATGYLLKTYSEEKFKSTIEKALKKHFSLEKRINFDFESTIVSIPIKDIYYIEYTDRRCYYHTNSRVYEIKQPLKNVMSELESYDFCRVHQYLIVNLAKVIELQPTHLILSNGIKIDLSRYRYDEVAKMYIKYRKETCV